MPPEKIDRYTIIRELGRGGMAIVYLATDPRFDRPVAIKVLPRQFTHDPKFQARFDREARTIASLEHPAIVPVYDFGEYEDQPFLVMRFMSGSSLADRIMKQGKLSLAEATGVFERLCPALDEAHQRNIIHRDLKPGNILFDHLNKAYLADFGIVKLAEETASFTGTAIVGTPAYMSPEQVQGQKVTSAIDIYSLGCMLFEMLTVRPPFLADTTMAVAFKHVHEPVPDIRTFNPGLPEDIQHVVAIAMAKKPEDRFDNANDIPLALRDLLKAQTIDREPTIEVLTMIDVASGVTDETEIEAWDEPQEKEVLKSKESIELLDSEEASVESPKIVHVGSYPIYDETEVENLTEPTSTSESVSGDVIESEGLQESQEEAVDKDSIEQDATQIVMASIRPRETTVNELPESPINESTENERGFQPNQTIPRWLIAIAAIAAILILIMFGSFWRTNRGQPAEPAVIPIAEEQAVWEEAAEEEWDPISEAEAEAEAAAVATAAAELAEAEEAATEEAVEEMAAIEEEVPLEEEEAIEEEPAIEEEAPVEFVVEESPVEYPSPILQRNADKMFMVDVPAGSFLMGSDEGDNSERPVHEVALDNFWIDQTEVNNEQFGRFVDATGYETTAENDGFGWIHAGGENPVEEGEWPIEEWAQIEGADWLHPKGPGSNLNNLAEHPVVLVSWEDADAYCAWIEGTLPSEAQWEYAARGPQNLTYPWEEQLSDRVNSNFCDENCDFDWMDESVNDGFAHTSPVGSYPSGASWVGALDMAGNVSEWVNDWYGESYYAGSPQNNPQGPVDGDLKGQRGGAWSSPLIPSPSSYRGASYPSDSTDNVGFRCVIPADTLIEEAAIEEELVEEERSTQDPNGGTEDQKTATKIARSNLELLENTSLTDLNLEVIDPGNSNQVGLLGWMGKGTVNEVAYTPDGRQIAVGSGTGVYFYDAETLEELKHILTESSVEFLAYSPDGKNLGVGFHGGNVQLWDAGTGALIDILEGQSDRVNDLAFSPDGEILASVGFDPGIRLHSTEDGSLMDTIAEFPEIIFAIGFSPNGEMMATAGVGSVLQFWDTADGSLINDFGEESGYDIAFSPDGELIAVASSDGINIREIPGGDLINTIETNGSSNDDLIFSPDGKTLATTDTVSVNLYDTANWSQVHQLYDPSVDWLSSIDFAPDGETLVSGSWNGTFQMWNMADGTQLENAEGYTPAYREMDLSPNGKYVAALPLDDSGIWIWDSQNKEIKNILTPPSGYTSGYISTFEFSPDGETIAGTTYLDGDMNLWRADDGQLLKRIEGALKAKTLTFSPKGDIVASGTREGILQIWDIVDGALISTIEGDFWNVESLAYSPDGELLAVGDYSGDVFLLNAVSGEVIKSFEHERDGWINTVEFSPDGSLIASINWWDAMLWDVESGELVHQLFTGGEKVRQVSFSPDGQLLATVTLDGLIQLWRVSDGKHLATLDEKMAEVHSIEFSEDGKLLVTSDYSGVIRFWGVPDGE